MDVSFLQKVQLYLENDFSKIARFRTIHLVVIIRKDPSLGLVLLEIHNLKSLLTLSNSIY
uniref:Uncharacterized protein n=1 Tax=Physcomitrium patens TaxID=3218 RepID=A0A2K1IUG3_PHYPA|nr:hypothetical protein PHYPA_024858 [Physcomitrium patens]